MASKKKFKVKIIIIKVEVYLWLILIENLDINIRAEIHKVNIIRGSLI